MASTNKTTHYELSQYIGSDKPSYLGDYNSDMDKIDGGIYDAQSDATSALAGAQSASLSANSALTAIGNLENLNTTTKTDLVSAINEVLVNNPVTELTGTITLTASETAGTYEYTSFSLDYPAGYTRNNTYVLAFQGSIDLGDNMGAYGTQESTASALLHANLQRNIYLTTSKINGSVGNLATSTKEYHYKILLMKIS